MQPQMFSGYDLFSDPAVARICAAVDGTAESRRATKTASLLQTPEPSLQAQLCQLNVSSYGEPNGGFGHTD